MTKKVSRPITILIAALGGEGGGVLAEWLVETAVHAGYHAQSTSIPGVAQRTGATTYYVEVHPEPESELGGRRPILSLSPVPGAVDLVIASELLEAARHVQAGMVTPDRTLLITSTGRTLTTLERMKLGDGRVSAKSLLALASKQAHRLVAFDMESVTREAGTVPSAVMFGAIAASGLLPMPRDAFEQTIRQSGRGVTASLIGFDLAWSAVNSPVDAEQRPPRVAAGTVREATNSQLEDFPASTKNFVHLGLQRVVNFQDDAYGNLYLQRLQRVLVAESRIDPQARHGHAMTSEAARYLALWMAYDDIVRVAHFKCSKSRFERVRTEVKADPEDLLRIVDYFKPGIPEIAGLLPCGLARYLTSWEARRRAKGKKPFSFPLHLKTTSVSGFLALRILSSLKGLRRSGQRYGVEQAMIEKWLDYVQMAAERDWQLAQEIVLCGRLIKGYGSTNDRGKENLVHILDNLVGGPLPDDIKIIAIREARDAALADEAGQALDQKLVSHGAPARPVKAQPITWLPRVRTRGTTRA